MPKSKRAKVVHLSKTTKKGKELTLKLFAAIRESADQYSYIHVFAVDNMRNTYLKKVRSHFASTGRMFFGKTKVMAKALGHTAEEEHLPGLHKLAPYLVGDVGLLFTSQRPEEVIEFFESYEQTDFARAGVTAPRDVTVPEGVVYSRGGEVPKEEDVPVAHSLEPTLRQWGMPTRLVKGKVMLDGPHEVCTEGQELNSHQTALLKMFGIALADFRVQVKAYYGSVAQEVTEVKADED